MLKEGNERFLAGKSVNCNLLGSVRATAEGQAPFAAIVGCIDSRVPPNSCSISRSATCSLPASPATSSILDIIGSLEFATKVVGARAIVVLGHTECGAIKGSIDQVKLGNLTKMLENFTPAIAGIEVGCGRALIQECEAGSGGGGCQRQAWPPRC